MHIFHIIKNVLLFFIEERRCMSCYIPFTPLQQNQPKNNIEQWLCLTCSALLQPKKKGYCPTCGYIYPDENFPVISCIKCMNTPPLWENFRFLSSYLGAYKHLLIQAKFKGETSTLKLLGILLSTYCLDLPTPDVIIPMPLHPSRLYARGFNQCQEISRPIAKKLSRPIKNNLLYRVTPTKHQTKLSKQQRLKNIQKAFTASNLVEGLRVLLIDDVMTTGTTLQQASKTLLAHKAKTVDVCVVARTPDFSSI